MQRFFKHRRAVADGTARVHQLRGFVTHTTALTFIAVGVLVVAFRVRTLSADETILKESVTLRVKPLKAGPLLKHAVTVKFPDEGLRDVLVNRETLGPRSSGVRVETDGVALECKALLFVNSVDEIANGLAGFDRANLAGGSVVIGAAHEENVVGANEHPHKARIDVGRNVSASKMSDVQWTARVGHACRDHRSL